MLPDTENHFKAFLPLDYFSSYRSLYFNGKLWKEYNILESVFFPPTLNWDVLCGLCHEKVRT